MFYVYRRGGYGLPWRCVYGSKSYAKCYFLAHRLAALHPRDQVQLVEFVREREERKHVVGTGI